MEVAQQVADHLNTFVHNLEFWMLMRTTSANLLKEPLGLDSDALLIKYDDSLQDESTRRHNIPWNSYRYRCWNHCRPLHLLETSIALSGWADGYCWPADLPGFLFHLCHPDPLSERLSHSGIIIASIWGDELDSSSTSTKKSVWTARQFISEKRKGKIKLGSSASFITFKTNLVKWCKE